MIIGAIRQESTPAEPVQDHSFHRTVNDFLMVVGQNLSQLAFASLFSNIF